MILVGLGNPGPEYTRTRHNAGFLVLEAARRTWRGPSWRTGPTYEHSRIRLAGVHHELVRPLTYMNCSGEAVAALLKAGAAPADFFVILDDIDLPLGRLRIRPHGGAGGHGGLTSILQAVAPGSVARLRIGVGRPSTSDETVGHVLGSFDEEEWGRFLQVQDRALEALQVVLRRGVVAAMNQFNGLAPPWEECENT